MMRTTAGMTLSQAEHAVEEAHPGWHVWHSDGLHIYATIGVSAERGSGTTLDAPTCEEMDHTIAEWEHAHPMAVAA